MALSTITDILTGTKPPLEDVVVTVAGSPFLGHSDAPVTLVEFTDFHCPFCGAYARETFPRLVHDYVDRGKVRYVIRNFPLEHAHPLARKAAEVVLCAQDQGKFWELHHRLFGDRTKLAPADISNYASAIGVDPKLLDGCTNSGKYTGAIEADLAEGHKLEVTGTPTFFIGYSDPATPSRIRAIRSIGGAAPYAQFAKTIADARARSPQGSEGQK